ncbi:MAG: DUF3501 family protein [Alphaproteobacteria bacterium]|nr:MAG: DUF3501 family protein [Alphaproteobacteria bacterium]
MTDTSPRQITRDDILSMDDYTAQRSDRRTKLVKEKKNRRVAVGPDVMFYFESHGTMWFQIHEMLYIEKGGENQIADELAAYNPLIPQGNELVATMMIEIEDEGRRARTLARLGHIEDQIFLVVGDEEARGVPEEDTDRTTADGKTSAVHFIHFPLTPAMVDAFKSGTGQAMLAIRHENYQHMAGISQAVREALAPDL